jgi:lactoylglutathione lyase
VMLMRKLDLKRVRVDLHDGTLTPLEKVTQVLSKLGVAEPQSHPQEALPKVPLPQLPTLTVRGRDALSMGNEQWGLERPCETLVAWRERRRTRPPSETTSVMFRDAFTILDTADVGRLSAFYVDRLGFEHGYRWPDQGEAIFRVVSLGPFSLGLSKTESLPSSRRTAFWLYTDDLDREIGRLRGDGVPVVAEPTDAEWGERMATISDPDGNLVHIGQRLPGAADGCDMAG